MLRPRRPGFAKVHVKLATLPELSQEELLEVERRGVRVGSHWFLWVLLIDSVGNGKLKRQKTRNLEIQILIYMILKVRFSALSYIEDQRSLTPTMRIWYCNTKNSRVSAFNNSFFQEGRHREEGSGNYCMILAWNYKVTYRKLISPRVGLCVQNAMKLTTCIWHF